MTTEHTPGPWRVDRHLGMIVGPHGEPITGEANFNLAAAAPDLLFELDGLVHFSDGFGIRGDGPVARELARWVEGARAAIDKARGTA